MKSFPNTGLSRRSLMQGSVSLGALFALAACSDTDEASAPSEEAVTIKHQFGETEVPPSPQRIVTLGYTDHEPLLALGIVPVGVVQWVPDWESGVAPWSEDKLKGEKPAIFNGLDLAFEDVAALKPDLITYLSSAGDQKDFETLSKIAPTIAAPEGAVPYGIGWQELTTTVTKAVGRQSEGKQLIAETEKLLAETAKENPEFEGKTVALISTVRDPGNIGVYLADDARGQLVSALGFEFNDYIKSLPKDNFFYDISAEKAGELESDLVIVFGDKTTTMDDVLTTAPTLSSLKAYKDGRFRLIEDWDETMAFSTSSVLSIPVALEKFVPEAKKMLA